jgi:hypothetical protein
VRGHHSAAAGCNLFESSSKSVRIEIRVGGGGRLQDDGDVRALILPLEGCGGRHTRQRSHAGPRAAVALVRVDCRAPPLLVPSCVTSSTESSANMMGSMGPPLPRPRAVSAAHRRGVALRAGAASLAAARPAALVRRAGELGDVLQRNQRSAMTRASHGSDGASISRACSDGSRDSRIWRPCVTPRPPTAQRAALRHGGATRLERGKRHLFLLLGLERFGS